jgi:hypothetical protein
MGNFDACEKVKQSEDSHLPSQQWKLVNIHMLFLNDDCRTSFTSRHKQRREGVEEGQEVKKGFACVMPPLVMAKTCHFLSRTTPRIPTDVYAYDVVPKPHTLE